jgi:adenylate kinase family enzyme
MVPRRALVDLLYPRPVQRIAINGRAGAGKSTLARRLADLLDLPYTEIDSLQHGADWQRRPTFVEDVTAIIDRDRWVIEFQYDDTRPLILARADTLVWLDLPLGVTMWRVVRRTVGRRVRRTELWNGNREGPLWRIVVDREHIIRWAWSSRHEAAQRIDRVRAERPDLPVVRLRTTGEVERWVGEVSLAGRPAPPR